MGFFGANGRGVFEEAGVEDEVDFVDRHLLQVGRHGRRLLRLQPSQVRGAAAGLPPLCLHRLAAAVGGRHRRDLDPQADARRRQARPSLGEQPAPPPGPRDLGFDLGTQEAQSAIIAVILPDQQTTVLMWQALLERGPLRQHGPPAGDAGRHVPCCAARSAPSIATRRSGRSSTCSTAPAGRPASSCNRVDPVARA